MQCKRHARDKVKAGTENGASGTKNDASGTENDVGTENDGSIENDAKVRKTMRARETIQKCEKRCKHGKRCKSTENVANEQYAKEKAKVNPRRKPRESVQGEVQNQNGGQVACMGLAVCIRSDKTRKTANETKSAF